MRSGERDTPEDTIPILTWVVQRMRANLRRIYRIDGTHVEIRMMPDAVPIVGADLVRLRQIDGLPVIMSETPLGPWCPPRVVEVSLWSGDPVIGGAAEMITAEMIRDAYR